MLATQTHLLEKYLLTRRRTESICQPLTPEDHVVQPVVDVSPPKWHLGHTTWFYEAFILCDHMEGYQVFHEEYAYLFNSYYQSKGDRMVRTDRGNMTRPSVKEVMAYRSYVDAHMEKFLENGLDERLEYILTLGLQHEEQHQELLMYDIKYILGNNPLFPAYQSRDTATTGQAGPVNWLEIPEGTYEIGYQGEGFCFDNEQGRHKVFLHAAAVSDRLVTNREYLEFMQDGGYADFRHWLSDGWDWVNQEEVRAPFHWHLDGDTWKTYSLQGGLKALDPDAPVSHVSYYEAAAYAKWKGCSLPDEAQWEVAADLYGNRDSGNFLENEQLEALPATPGNHQFYGDLWEWTSSAYLPYPYYQAPDGALGEYNGKFMVNQMVLRGGSCATPKEHIRKTYRNFFHAPLRWMFSGIRLAKYL